MVIKINNKEYNVKVAETPEEKRKGLQGIKELKEDEGMLFVFDEAQEVSFYMKDTEIPLDIIFINDDYQVIKVYKGKPFDETLVTVDDVQYVLELNQNSGVKKGDYVELDDEEPPVMKVLAPDGSTQMELWGGERIVSRIETKILIKKAKKAEEVKDNEEQFKNKCKSLGKYMFKVLNKQDNREPEYVKIPD